MTKTVVRFDRFFSVDSAKAIKAQGFGYLNAINYMAPHQSAGIKRGAKIINFCSHASAGCIALCLGEHAGQAAMINKATGTNAVRESRKRKAVYFWEARQMYLNEMSLHIARLYMRAYRMALKLAVRTNGATDLAYEGMPVHITEETARAINKAFRGMHTVAPGIYRSIFAVFPFIQFVDYTKNPNRFDKPLPANLHLTFSLSEDNAADAFRLLRRGVNVAVVFGINIKKGEPLPATWQGFTVVDGDKHDLRFLDPKAAPGMNGFIVGLSPKGNKAKKDRSGFVIRDFAAAPLAVAA